MTRPAKCEPYTYVARADQRHPLAAVGWKCACGSESDRANFATRRAAIDDWTRHAEGAAK